MFDNIFWLCSQCLSGYEVSYGNFCITWNTNYECSIRVRVGKKIRNVDVMSEVHKNGALSLSVTFEELAPNIGLSSINKVRLCLLIVGLNMEDILENMSAKYNHTYDSFLQHF